MKGKCCGFKFLDKIFRDKGKSFTFIPFSLLACAVVHTKSKPGCRFNSLGIQQYDILNRSVARILSGCLFGD